MLKPIGSRVVVEPLEEKKNGKFEVVKRVDDTPNRGKVTAISEDDEFSFKVGDTIVFDMFTKVEIADEKYYMVDKDNIVGVIHD